MTPAQLAKELRMLSTDLELSGRTRDALTLAETAAYLIEVEAQMSKVIAQGFDTLQVSTDAITKLRAAYDKIEELQRRNETLELQLAYMRP